MFEVQGQHELVIGLDVAISCQVAVIIKADGQAVLDASGPFQGCHGTVTLCLAV